MGYFKHKPQEEEEVIQPRFLHPIQDDDDFSEDDVPEDEPISDAEDDPEHREGNLRLFLGLTDLVGVVVGVVVILLLLTVLISLVNWVLADMSQFFSLLKSRT